MTETRSPDVPARRKSYHESERLSAQSAILHIVAKIPRGSVATYGQVAQLAGLPGRARLVGRVLAEAGPDPAVPWQRVINAQGRIALPKGSPSHLEQRRRRLRAEGIVIRSDRIDLRRFQWRAHDASPLLD